MSSSNSILTYRKTIYVFVFLLFVHFWISLKEHEKIQIYNLFCIAVVRLHSYWFIFSTLFTYVNKNCKNLYFIGFYRFDEAKILPLYAEDVSWVSSDLTVSYCISLFYNIHITFLQFPVCNEMRYYSINKNFRIQKLSLAFFLKFVFALRYRFIQSQWCCIVL